MITNLPQKIIESGHGAPAALLTTSGFENWLEMNLPVKTNFITLLPERAPFLIERDFIFGIDERTNSNGHLEKNVNDTEIEFLIREFFSLKIFREISMKSDKDLKS